MEQKKKFLLVISIATLFSLQIFPLAHAEGSRLEDPNGIFHFLTIEIGREKYKLCQETEHWEKLTNPNFPLTLSNWRIVTNPGSSDKYIDKRIIGTVKNNSKKEFSEVKVEFTVYDEDGNQIAIVLSNHYDFKPGDAWKFQIPVTEDVERAELKGLYVHSNEKKPDR